MSSPRRHSPAVYRRRRLVALLIAILLVAVIAGGVWLLVAQPWRTAGSTTPVASPAATDGAASIPAPTSGATDPAVVPSADASAPAETPVQPTPGATDAVIEACERDDVTVEPVLDSDSYGTDQLPQMGIKLTNVSEGDCAINVGTTHQVFTVSSGADVWWRSTDCQKEPSDMVITLAAGQVVESAAPLAWDRTRSSVSTCDGQRPAAVGGGATYNLTVSLGGIAGEGSAQFLLF